MTRFFTKLHFLFFAFLLLLSSCADDQVDINFDMTFPELSYSVDGISQPETEIIIVNEVFESGLQDALQLKNSGINHLRSVRLENMALHLQEIGTYSFNDFVKIDVFLEKNNRSVSTLLATTNLNDEGQSFAFLKINNQELSTFFEDGDPVLKMKAITRQGINIPFILEVDATFKVEATIEE